MSKAFGADNLLLIGQCRHTRQGFAFEEFEAGSSAGGDVGDLRGDAGLMDGGYGVSSSDDSGGVGVVGYGVGDGVGALGEGGHLEDAHGAVPDDGVGVGDFFRKEL